MVINLRALLFPILLLSHSVDARLTPVHQALYNTDNQHGILHFSGEILVSPCILAAESQEQDIVMGITSARWFRQAGDRTKQVTFVINLQDCLAGSHGYHRDSPGEVAGFGKPARLTGGQMVSLSFSGESDDLNPELLRVQGVKGLGLRLMDAQGNPLILNQAQRAYLLTPGDNSLTFKVALESTRKYVVAGNYYGMIRLMMEYL